jgi:hypothetical protein
VAIGGRLLFQHRTERDASPLGPTTDASALLSRSASCPGVRHRLIAETVVYGRSSAALICVFAGDRERLAEVIGTSLGYRSARLSG